MNTLTIVLYTVLTTIAAGSIAFVVYTIRKANPQAKWEETFPSAWNKIRPILSELFINIYSIYSADKGGFGELLAYSVSFVKNKIDEADFLQPEEKQLFTEQFIKSILEPKLRELYDKKIQK